MPTQDNVQQIKARLDIVDVLSDYMQLKPAGQNLKGLCPFHNEKSPSFMVNKERQMWHCFGCNSGGDMFAFVEKIEGVDFSEALEILARKAGIVLQRYEAVPGERNQRLRLFKALEEAQKFYSSYLQSPAAISVRQYLSTRQVNQDSLTIFGLGYAPREWDKLTIHLRNQGFSFNELTQAGLSQVSSRGPGSYDRFRDRLMFPISDVQGRVIGFGGRVLNTAATEAKYINSPQGPVYNKSLVVYNLDRAKQYIREAGYAVLVEGYMDIIGSWQAGIKNVVATSGTALTTEQIKLIKRYCTEIRLAFDADLAGRSAAERGIDLAVAAGLEVKVITLPYGKDPDECAKHDPAGLRQAIEQALPIVDHAFKTVLKEVDINSRQGNKLASDKLLTAIAKLPDPVEQDYYLRQLSRELRADESAVRQKFVRLINRTPIQAATSVVAKSVVEKKDNDDRAVQLSRRLLGLVLKFPVYLKDLQVSLLPSYLVADDLISLYNQLVIYYNSNQTDEINSWLDELSAEPSFGQLIGILQLQAERDFIDMDLAQVQAELLDLAKQLKVLYLNSELKRLSQNIRLAELAGNQTELEEALASFTQISQELTAVQQ